MYPCGVGRHLEVPPGGSAGTPVLSNFNYTLSAGLCEHFQFTQNWLLEQAGGQNCESPLRQGPESGAWRGKDRGQGGVLEDPRDHPRGTTLLVHHPVYTPLVGGASTRVPAPSTPAGPVHGPACCPTPCDLVRFDSETGPLGPC